MDFKISIECKKCLCSFELRPQDFKDRPSMECPNCGQAFPSEPYQRIKTGVCALGAVEECICEDSNNPFSYLFNVQVKSFKNSYNF